MGEVEPRIDGRVRERLLERYRAIDGPTCRRLTEAALAWLRTNQQIVNSLNVFPVPDGDTGTNMVLTMQAAWDEIASHSEAAIGRLAKSIAQGALMGARGNSGVILSQLWRGFARALDDATLMDVPLFVRGLAEARDTAYKGVVRPVEGTILTVAKDVASAAEQAQKEGASSALQILERIVQAAHESVQRTPDLLPVLKQAGVVDSGGMGLYLLLEGMLRSAYRQPLDTPTVAVRSLGELTLEQASESVEPGQDWEVVVDFRPDATLDVQGFYRRLEAMGTSIQVGEGDGLYRMHIHVPDRKEYDPIDYVRSLGTVTRVAIENLMAQSAAQLSTEKDRLRLTAVQPGQIGAIAVSPGFGISRVFASLGIAAVVDGGQTMNPSTQEILRAFEELPTDKIIILPNNKNIELAARQAAEHSVKSVAVIPSHSVPQGIAAMLCFEVGGDFDEIVGRMTGALKNVRQGEITIATRSVEIDGVPVREGQVIGLLHGKLATAGDSLQETLLETLRAGRAQEAELITLFYGADLSAQQANQLADLVRQRWPEQEVEVVEGGQPHYPLILSIE